MKYWRLSYCEAFTGSSDSTDFRFSRSPLGLSCDAFKFEDWAWLGQIASVFVNYPKDWDRVIEKANVVHLGLAGFLVKYPLVDLDPSQPRLLFSFLAKLTGDFPVVTLKQVCQDSHLLFCLAHSVN